jgi:hypothetical protein
MLIPWHQPIGLIFARPFALMVGSAPVTRCRRMNSKVCARLPMSGKNLYKTTA